MMYIHNKVIQEKKFILPVVTGDPEFKQLEKEIQVFWV